MKKRVLFAALSFVLGYSLIHSDRTVRIEAEENEPYLYYYDQLSVSERKFTGQSEKWISRKGTTNTT